MKTRSLNHSRYCHHYHLVWGTKYRRKYLKEYVKDEFVHHVYKVIKKYPTLFIGAINTDQDHVHIEIDIPPNIAVSRVVQLIKQQTSIHLRKKFKFIRNMYLENSIWSVGYFTSTLGLNEEVIKKYIEQQGKQEDPRQMRIEFL